MTRAEQRTAARAAVKAKLATIPPDRLAQVRPDGPVPVPVVETVTRLPEPIPDLHKAKSRGLLVRVDCLTPAGEGIPESAARFLIARDRGPDLLCELIRLGTSSVFIRQIAGEKLFTEPYGCISASSLVYRLP